MHQSPNSHLEETLDTLVQTRDMDSPYTSFLLPFTEEYLWESHNLVEKFSDRDMMLLVGIWGSNLWTMALYDALRDTLPTGKSIYFFDTPDPQSVQKEWKEISRELALGKKLVLTIISKSGTTTETIALASYLLWELSTGYKGQYDIVTISDPGSRLDDLATKEGWHRLNLPKHVWGRYSVLSNVGLFPLTFLGVDTRWLVSGARSSIESYISRSSSHSATKVAQMLYDGYPKRHIFEHWFFSKRLESMGKWYRQLLAESIGKIVSDGSTTGITPSVAIGTIDLHSIAQLDLSHVSDRSIALVREISNTSILRVPDTVITSLLPHLQGKWFSQIMDAAFEGFRDALHQKSVPTYTYELDGSNAFAIGYWLQTKMLEVALLGVFLWVNAFDQPNVEDYKKLMEPRLKTGI